MSLNFTSVTALKNQLIDILTKLQSACDAEGMTNTAAAMANIKNRLGEFARGAGPAGATLEFTYDQAKLAYDVIKGDIDNAENNPHSIEAVVYELLEYITKMDQLTGINSRSATTSDINALRKIFEEQRKEIITQTSNLLTRVNTVEAALSEKTSIVETAAQNATSQIDSLLQNTQAFAAERANSSIYEDYKGSANAEKSASDIYRRLSIGAMIFTAAVPLVSAVESYLRLTPLNIREILSRVALSIVLGVLAAYFARESGRHRKQQYIYQQYSLNLHALPLFIADLEPESKKALKAELAKTIFTSSHESKDDGSSYPLNMQEVMLALIEKLPPSSK